jgi:hypothetical protein
VSVDGGTAASTGTGTLVQVQIRRDTAANWTAGNPTLASGELGLESDTGKFKFGSGSTAWTSLSYGSAAGITGKTTPTGDIVGTTDAQAISNKTFNATNTFPTLNQSTTGSAAKLTTARTINGVPFDGSANISTSNNGWQAADHGFVAWNYDFANQNGSSQFQGGAAGTLTVMGIKIPAATTISNVVLWVLGAGVSLTSGQCFAGLYQNGTLIGSTADQSTAWQTVGLYTMPLVGGPYSVSAGTVYVGFYCRGTTSPALARTSTGLTSAVLNVGLTSNNYRCATANTGLTTALPSTLSAQTAAFTNYWAAVS